MVVAQVQQGLGDFASTNRQLHDLYGQALTWQTKYEDEGATWYTNYGYKVGASLARLLQWGCIQSTVRRCS